MEDLSTSTPNYYAVIPADIRYSDKVCPNAKLLYGEITALCNKEGFCWASNQYFADLYKVDPRSIREWIGELSRASFIRYEVKDNYRREIFLLPLGRNLPTPPHKSSTPLGRNLPHNNTINNTMNITNNNPFKTYGKEYERFMNKNAIK